jgi:hypothetical protein
MKSLFAGLLILLAILVQGCAYPQPVQVEQKDNRPAIGIDGAPWRSILYVDGLQMGKARDYKGKKHVLLIESGKHLIEVRSKKGKVILSETVFLSGTATKILTVYP